MFMSYQNNLQSQHFAKTWQKTLKSREIMKNNYHIYGDLKRAKIFVAMVNNVSFCTNSKQISEQVVFLNQQLTVPLYQEYTFAI